MTPPQPSTARLWKCNGGGRLGGIGCLHFSWTWGGTGPLLAGGGELQIGQTSASNELSCPALPSRPAHPLSAKQQKTNSPPAHLSVNNFQFFSCYTYFPCLFNLSLINTNNPNTSKNIAGINSPAPAASD